jgi:glycosyltransferase involved in cell wall biosynthesis
MRIVYSTVGTSGQSGATLQMYEMAAMLEQRGGTPIMVLPPGATARGAMVLHTVSGLIPPRVSASPAYQFRYWPTFLTTALRVRKVLRQEQPAAVHLNEIVDLQPALAARWSRIPIVWSVRAGMSTTPRLAQPLGKLAVKWASRVVVVSQSVQDHLFGWYANSDGKVTVLRDAPRFFGQATPEDAVQVRERLGCSPEDFLVVQVSKLIPPKGHADLVEAAAILRAENVPIRVAVAGGVAEGREAFAEQLERRVKELELGERYRFLGQCSEIPAVLAACDVAVHCPTFRDPLPNVVLEAMVAERPVVGSNIGGVPEMIDADVTGFLCEPANPASLAAALRRVFELPQDRRLAMGRAGRKRVLEHFGPERYADGLMAIYKGVTGGTR